MKNSDFLRAIYGELGDGEYGWTASFRANPNSADADWSGRAYKHTPALAALVDGRLEDNNFFTPTVLSGTDERGRMRRVKAQAARPVALVADDVVPDDLLGSVSWTIETSPQKFQSGLILDQDDPDVHDLELFDAVMQAMAGKGLVPKDASGNNAVRYVRLPNGTNTKPRESGPWSVRLTTWSEQSYTLADACAVFGLDLEEIRQAPSAQPERQPAATGNDTASLLAAIGAHNPAERNYHDPLLRLTSKMVAAGMAPGAVVEHVRGVMLAVQPSDAHELERWRSRYDEIPRMVAGAEKYRPADKPEVTIALPQLSAQAPAQGLVTYLPELARLSGQVSWLVKGMVPADSLGILFGASGTYKSFLTLDLCLHVAHGMRWMDKRTRSGTVLYVASEGGAGIHRRVQAWHAENGRELAQNFAVCITPLLLSEAQQLETLATAIEAMPERPTLIVIDTLSQTFTGDENAASDIGNYLRAINAELRARFNATVLIVHHTGHSASERPRGSSALTANVDFLLGVFRPDAQAMSCTLETIKQKDGDKAQACNFELKRHVVDQDEDGEEITSLAAVYSNVVDTFVAKVKAKLGKYENAILGRLEHPCRESTLRDLVMGMCPTQEAGRKAFTRAFNTLQSMNLLEPVSTGVWKKREGAA